ncbi:response regulator [Coraliomargarita parva]|uniref:response regulator n=1 Tax=Coraliomargarita parva TaxID=3014050 RepID=UPI0022B403A4|nr:response regulator [Coraliomargarita parva]
MNILLIEDEQDLATTGIMQLELMGHTVKAVYDLAEAEAFMQAPEFKINLVIADHRLPDGLGIDYVLEARKQHAGVDYVIVSGCLTSDDMARLDSEHLPYYHKPLLYNKLIESFRKLKAMRAPTHVNPPVTASSPEPEATPVPESEAAPVPEANPPKKRFGFFGFGKKK